MAVEIPSLGEVSGLPFASGIVVTGSSNIAVALKATPSSWVYKSFTLTGDTDFTTGDSIQACQYRNFALVAVDGVSNVDLTLCQLMEVISSVTNPYDGNYHIVSTGATFAGAPAKIKFKFTRNSSNLIETYESFACDKDNVQLTFANYAISGTSITETLKTIRSTAPQKITVTMTGTLDTNDSTRYTSVKDGTYSFAGVISSGAMEGAISMSQAPTTMKLNGFDSRGDGSNVVRLYGQADQSNTSSPFSISGYTFGATATTPGAATLIDNGTTSKGCWDNNQDPTTCLGPNNDAVTGQTPKTASTQTITAFSGSQAWDCSGTVEATGSFSFGSSSCYARFTLTSNHIDCTTATQGDLTVTPTISATTLSTNSASPTSGVGVSPSILLTASRALDTTSMNSTTVKLLDTTESNESLAQVSINRSTYNSDNTTLTLTLNQNLTSGKTYKLVLVGSSTAATSGTVIRAPGADPPKDQLQSTGSYYITP